MKGKSKSPKSKSKSKKNGLLKIRLPHTVDRQCAIFLTGHGDKATLSLQSGLFGLFGMVSGRDLYRLGASIVKRLDQSIDAPSKQGKSTKRVLLKSKGTLTKAKKKPKLKLRKPAPTPVDNGPE